MKEVVITAYANSQSIRKVSRQIGLSRNKVRAILENANISILSNDDALLVANRKHERKTCSNNLAERAYLYGFVLGDVHVYKKSKFTLRAVTSTTKKDFVDLFESLFSGYGHIRCKKYGEYSQLHADLDYKSFSFLEERQNDLVPKWINDFTFIDFLSGYIDAEGCIMIRKAGNYFQYVVKISTESVGVLREMKERLMKIGITSSLNLVFKAGNSRILNGKNVKYNKDYYELVVSRKNETAKLLSLLNLRHKSKLERKKLLQEVLKKDYVHWQDVRPLISTSKPLAERIRL